MAARGCHIHRMCGPVGSQSKIIRMMAGGFYVAWHYVTFTMPCAPPPLYELVTDTARHCTGQKRPRCPLECAPSSERPCRRTFVAPKSAGVRDLSVETL